MIDTVRFEIKITPEQKAIVDEYTDTTVRYETCTGTLKYEFTRAELKGSYDSRIHMEITDKVYKKIENVVRKVKVDYYILTIELSFHKFLLGHNCYGGSSNLRFQTEYFCMMLYLITAKHKPFFIPGLKLDPEQINFTRIDYAYVYRFGHFNQVRSFISSMKNTFLGQIKPELYKQNTTVMYSTENWSLKMYDKYTEFLKHDRKKLLKSKYFELTEEFENYVNGIMRVEYTIRKRQLQSIYDSENINIDIDIKEIEKSFKLKLDYLESLKGKDNEKMKTVRDVVSVRNRLYENLSSVLAGRVFGTYMNIMTSGFDITRELMQTKTGNNTFYRHVSVLKNLAISLTESNVSLGENKILYPDEFNLTNEKYRILASDIDCLYQIAV